MLTSRQQKGKEFLALDGFNHDTFLLLLQLGIHTFVSVMHSGWLLQGVLFRILSRCFWKLQKSLNAVALNSSVLQNSKAVQLFKNAHVNQTHEVGPGQCFQKAPQMVLSHTFH